MNEGWTWLSNSRKWHYFRDGRALCGRFLLLSDAALQPDKTSPDNCAWCLKKRLGEIRKIDSGTFPR